MDPSFVKPDPLSDRSGTVERGATPCGFTDQKSSAMSSVLVALAPVEGLMTMTDARPLGADEATFIAAARSGDTARFSLITERHRRSEPSVRRPVRPRRGRAGD